ncbi:peptidase dimerization domain-containing protein [Neobacillus sp. 179-C4.2 HS]|uniref:Peptidase dimerization domain-containing protein n=1 Tax=Neobacillus driksii TaxID=3035913 RepID=A0ABV4YSJ1_9BACI|nr:peptidase dimerization domain-containing protein [Neobacillus sp. 179.-C4.2 HS]
MHSGMFGEGVQNANHLLVLLLSTLHDANGKVNINQFYDDVLELTEFEKEQIKALGFDEEELKKSLSLTELTGGETNYPYYEKISSRPTLELNGIWGGFQGEGTKTAVVPNDSPVVLMGFGLPDENLHAPNEHFNLENFDKGGF